MLENLEELALYKQYLNTIQKLLNKYFEDQKEYLCCKAGCSKCCETGQYPLSKIEFDYLIIGVFALDKKTQIEIAQRIKQLKSDFENTENKENFMYRCPFLNNDGLCLVYEYRGLICRTFGLISRSNEDKLTLPFCYEFGLNYSKVYNPETKKIDYEKVNSLGYKNWPQDYKVSLKRLTDPNLFTEKYFDFGDIKPLIKWL